MNVNGRDASTARVADRDGLGSERACGEPGRKLPAQDPVARGVAHAPVMNHPGTASAMEHPPAMRRWPSARDVTHCQPNEAAEECAGSHPPLRAHGNIRLPFEGLPGCYRRRAVDLQRVVRDGRPKLVALGTAISERPTIDQQLRWAQRESHGKGVSMAMTTAQRAVRSGVDHTDRSHRIPAVTKNRDAAWCEIHVEPVRIYGGRRAQP